MNSSKVAVLFLSILFSIVFSGCKKEDPDNTEVEDGDDSTSVVIPSSDYQPLAIGNYWIYARYKVDSNNIYSVPFGVPDSVYVSKDTIINSKTYFKFEGDDMNDNKPYFRCDSAGYLVDERGIKFFSTTNFTDTICRITDTIAEYYIAFKMENKDSIIISPELGALKTYNFRGYFYYEPSVPIEIPRPYPFFYAKDIGLIKNLLFVLSFPDVYERRLIRYHVN